MQFVRRWTRLIRFISLALICTSVSGAAVLLVACGDGNDEEAKVQDPPVSLIATGVGEKTIVGAAFAPQNITVPAGSTVSWFIASDEPHQVTFFGTGLATPEGSARQWARTIEPGSTTEVDGSVLLHTGVMSKDEKVSFTFPKTGLFKYFCPIHQGMDGTVEVVPEGKDYTTQAEADADARQEGEALLSQIEPTRRDTQARAKKESLPDGTSLWTVPTGPKVTVPTGYLEIKEYFPAELKISKGDTVRWVFETSHSVTFLPQGMQLPNPAPAAAKPSDAFDPTLLFTSAVPPRQPGGPNPTWDLKFETTGSFAYICQLHYARLGHVGTILVE